MKKNAKKLSALLLLGILPVMTVSAKSTDNSRSEALECPKFAKPFVDGYKTIETSVVKGYATIEDKCVGLFFKKKDESIAQTKERLSRNREKAATWKNLKRTY